MAHPYLRTTRDILKNVETSTLTEMTCHLTDLRDRDGRLFCIGNGGGAAHATHFASDLRKFAHIRAYAQDNMTELTASINDDGWAGHTARWLDIENYTANDGLFVFSVGGGSDTLSANLRWAYSHAKGTLILGITGRPGALADYATCQIVLNADTFQTESIQAVLAHLLVSELT